MTRALALSAALTFTAVASASDFSHAAGARRVAIHAEEEAPLRLVQGLERERRDRFRIDRSLGEPKSRSERRDDGLDGMPGHGIGVYTGNGVGSYTGGGIGSYTGGGIGSLGGAATPDGRGLRPQRR